MLALVAGCSVAWSRGDTYRATLVGGPPTSLTQWSAFVQAGAAQWAPAFDAKCPFPFTLDQVSGKKFVALVTKAAWNEPTADEGYTSTAGLYVMVDADADHRAIITHEFGHAMGLKHNSRLTSIMYPTVADTKVPDAQDIKDARAAMGCL